ncbi:hypothetical protein ACFYKX_10985 [Cytobacillus sp. FJAT-54145]|uniref:Uncharacterized protein n=1 Tax=Cytobacillus spartinae TaxID=3299023 RepID=A0ABW6KDZ4_9BACI
MSFTEWYEKTYQEKWHEDYAWLYRFASEVSKGYETYCKEHNIQPIWNG